VVAGFAGSTADAFTLLERLEKKLEANPGNWHGDASSWPRTGGWTSICATLKPC